MTLHEFGNSIKPTKKSPNKYTASKTLCIHCVSIKPTQQNPWFPSFHGNVHQFQLPFRLLGLPMCRGLHRDLTNVPVLSTEAQLSLLSPDRGSEWQVGLGANIGQKQLPRKLSKGMPILIKSVVCESYSISIQSSTIPKSIEIIWLTAGRGTDIGCNR